MNPYNQQTFKSVDASVNQTSQPIDTTTALLASVQVVVTGTSTGTVTIQGSNDASSDGVQNTAPSNFTALAAGTAVAGGNNYIIPLQNLCYNWIRVVYTAGNAQAGTLTANTKTLSY
jgi:hypothetical protein